VFTPVLAKRSNPNRCHWPYVASRKLRPSAQEYVWLRCAELAPFRRWRKFQDIRQDIAEFYSLCGNQISAFLGL